VRASGQETPESQAERRHRDLTLPDQPTIVVPRFVPPQRRNINALNPIWRDPSTPSNVPSRSEHGSPARCARVVSRMDPITIVSAAISLTTGIAKASFAVSEFVRTAQDASKDLDSVCRELQALAAVVDPLTRSLARARGSDILPDDLIIQIGEALEGCDTVVEQIAVNVRKYQRDKVWSKAKWAMFGQGDMQKLRESLEAYKMALSLGFHAISM